MAQPVITYMAKYPEFIKKPAEVNLIGVNGGKIECDIYGVPKPKIQWFKDFHPLKETARRQAHHYPPQTHTLFFEDYITQGMYVRIKIYGNFLRTHYGNLFTNIIFHIRITL